MQPPPTTEAPLGPLLALDTATLQAGVALIDGQGRELASRRDRVTTHSERLLPLIAEVLAAAGLTVDALEAIACGAGPGSFTGLRIGLATAKGLCLASGRPLLMVSSLAALARRAPPGAIAVPCIDAYKGEVYAGFYQREAEGLRLLAPEAVLAPAALAAWLASARDQGPGHRGDGRGPAQVHLIGDGALRWPELAVPGIDGSDAAPPDPLDVARLALSRRLRPGGPPGPKAPHSDDLAAAVPTYIRPSEAELNCPGPKRA